jgi:hypothetical protein
MTAVAIDDREIGLSEEKSDHRAYPARAMARTMERVIDNRSQAGNLWTS